MVDCNCFNSLAGRELPAKLAHRGNTLPDAKPRVITTISMRMRTSTLPVVVTRLQNIFFPPGLRNLASCRAAFRRRFAEDFGISRARNSSPASLYKRKGSPV